ncbi:MAG TPA: molybdenum cofactor biosynthesis protein MoaE [Acidimicrobiales bacterium]|nr:molybdenum cofactor biosynthesis protein MoaE [Acidimicrobiales bacterium]
MSAGSLTRLPPPTGADWLACTPSVLDAGAAAAWVVRPDCGAVVTFTGTVRDHAGPRTGVELLEYEAYEEHVVPALAKVAAGVRERVERVGRVALWHRVGALAVTDVAVVVAVSTPHRDGAFQAARWAIDELKATAPIWKREHWPGGAEWVRCDHGTGPLEAGSEPPPGIRDQAPGVHEAAGSGGTVTERITV